MTTSTQPGWLSLEQALSLSLSQLSPVTESVNKPLDQALGYVVAEDIIAPLAVPPADNSAMDGYALYASDSQQQNPLPIVYSQLAGMPVPTETLAKGCAVRIMTGALIPPGADCVVMQENTTAYDNTVVINKPALMGENIRRTGADIEQHSIVLAKGTRLAAPHLVLLASLGQADVRVYRALRVGIMATGDELISAGLELASGQIYESNRMGTRALLAGLPVDITDYGIVADDKAALRSTLSNAAQSQDLLISSGGVSVGDADYVKEIVASLGDISFWKVAIKPGKPFAFGKLGNCIFCGLPGNPVSAFVTAQQLVLPVIRCLTGSAEAKQPQPLMLKATLQTPLRRRAGRQEFVRAVMHKAVDGNWLVTPLPKQSSGVMTTVTQANCYLVVAAQTSALNSGDVVDIQPFSHLIQQEFC